MLERAEQRGPQEPRPSRSKTSRPRSVLAEPVEQDVLRRSRASRARAGIENRCTRPPLWISILPARQLDDEPRAGERELLHRAGTRTCRSASTRSARAEDVAAAAAHEHRHLSSVRGQCSSPRPGACHVYSRRAVRRQSTLTVEPIAYGSTHSERGAEHDRRRRVDVDLLELELPLGRPRRRRRLEDPVAQVPAGVREPERTVARDGDIGDAASASRRPRCRSRRCGARACSTPRGDQVPELDVRSAMAPVRAREEGDGRPAARQAQHPAGADHHAVRARARCDACRHSRHGQREQDAHGADCSPTVATATLYRCPVRISALSRRYCASAKAGASSGSPSRRPTSPRSSPTSRSSPTTSCAAKTVEFRQRLENGESLEELLFEAFAAVREARKRESGQRHVRRPADGRDRPPRGRHRRDEDRRGQDVRRDAAALPERAARQRRPPRHGQRLPRQARRRVEPRRLRAARHDRRATSRT